MCLCLHAVSLFSLIHIHPQFAVLCPHSVCYVNADLEPPEMWRDREPTDREVKAVTVLQAGFRGHLVREILDASKPGKQLNVHAHTQRI